MGDQNEHQQHFSSTMVDPSLCCCCCNSNNNNFFLKPTSPPPSDDQHIARNKNLKNNGAIHSSHATFHNPCCSQRKPPLFSNQQQQASNSIKLRRIRECLRELRKRWEEMIEEGEEDSEAETDELVSKDECDAEEAVSVEWTDDKFLTICFKCQCSKAHQILLSGNICYHKLV